MEQNRKLVLKTGEEFYGFGYGKETIGELVFNTSMVGYQEIATDPSYNGQIVVMTYPLIGNYGINDDDSESRSVKLNGFVVREYNDKPSNFRSTKTFNELLEDYNVPLLTGVDTRAITRIIREKGSMIAMITDINKSKEECLEILNNTTLPRNQVEFTSAKKKWVSRARNAKYHVVCIDFGTKLNIVRCLNEVKCDVTIVPHDISIKDLENLKPDGLFLSNGPGDPEVNQNAIEIVKYFKGKIPIMGICLGHQIISLAYGAKTYKMKFGHRGGNHPVKSLISGRIEITSQNHSYAVDLESVKNTDLEVTHINLLDNTVEGVRCTKDLLFSIQYHPESAAGPEDSKYLFMQFVNNMDAKRGRK